MLERILQKLQCSSIEEFWEKEKVILKKYADYEIERISPLTKLDKDEMDYFETFILPQYTK